MRTLSLLPFLCLIFISLPTFASVPADAKEIARINNCVPKKVEVFQQALGEMGSTTYRVECTIAKAKDENAPKTANALLIKCAGSLCELLRPVVLDDK